MVQVFVDDSDPNVVFSANWFTGLGTYEYNRTAHGTTAPTSNVVYTFKGTSISAYGTIGALPNNNSKTPNGTWSIDGAAPTNFQVEITNATLYRQLYFQTPDLSDDSDHTLKLTFHTENTTIVWFDYMAVTPSTRISDGGNKLVKVDDTDPSIQYTGGWNEEGTLFDSNKTAHLATSSSSKAMFSFYGTSISVFGRLANITASPENPTATFTLDDDAPVVFSTVPQAQLSTLYQVPIFQSSNLSLNHHQLQIEAHDDNSNVWLDFFMYDQPASPTSTTLSSPTSSTSYRSSNHTGAIVGGVIGGVVGFVLIVAVLAWLWRKRQRQGPPGANSGEMTPYLVVDSNHARASLDHLASTTIRTAGTLPMSTTSSLPSGGSPAGLTFGSSVSSQASLYKPFRKPPLQLSPLVQRPSTAPEVTPVPSEAQLQESNALPPPYETHGL